MTNQTGLTYLMCGCCGNDRLQICVEDDYEIQCPECGEVVERLLHLADKFSAEDKNTYPDLVVR